jgi:Tol biopolymer transport system component
VARGVAASSTFYVPVSASSNGVIAYAPAADDADIGWVDQTGERFQKVLDGRIADFALSHDLDRLAFSEIEPKSGRANVAIMDFASGNERLITDAPETDASAVWTHDSRIVFRSNRSSLHNLYVRSADGAAPAVPLTPGATLASYPTSVSRDGRLLIYFVDTGGPNQRDIWAQPLDGNPAYPLVSTAFDELQGQVSPDGEWLAYTAIENSQPEVYVRPLRATGERGVRVSTAGGSEPRWQRPDGRQLYYVARSGVLMALPTGDLPKIDATRARSLFPIAVSRNYVNTTYDVSPDGRFLIRIPHEDPATAPLNVFTGWTPPAALEQ